MARRYKTDPYQILTWDPDRFAMAFACYQQAMAAYAEAGERKSAGFPVFLVGEL